MPSERKRPWFLVLALLGALALGMTGAYGGWAAWTLYREPVDVSLVGQGFSDPADRAAVQSRVDAYLHTLDAAKPRGWPVAVATLLLGATVVLLSMRVLGGSGGARAALVQLVLAQAGLNAASYWLLRDVVEADTRLFEAHAIAELHERFPTRSRDDLVLQMTRGEARAKNPVGLVLSTLGSLLVVVGLTRRRSREFLETAAAAVEER
ncbi:MAG TPA: hypothetical protein VIF09_05900 [Polyangiaceae bacterium]|jgi:hypothetical protein